MHSNPIQLLLKQLNVFTPLSSTFVNEAEQLFSFKKLDKDAYFLKAGEQAKHIGYLLSGAIREYYLDKKETEYNKAFCFENDFTGSYYDLVKKEKSSVCIQALSNCELLIANFEKFQELAQKNMEWLNVSHYIITNLLIKKCEREQQLLTLTAAERYRLLMQQQPQLEDLVPHYQIASYLGITPISLSRIRHNKQ
jgi:CRP-like cAMP-binding protein